MNIKTLHLALVVNVLVNLVYCERHPECGEPPTLRYKDLAKAIGWDWNKLIKFIKTETPDEYTKLLKTAKLYADCLALSQIPI